MADFLKDEVCDRALREFLESLADSFRGTTVIVIPHEFDDNVCVALDGHPVISQNDQIPEEVAYDAFNSALRARIADARKKVSPQSEQ